MVFNRILTSVGLHQGKRFPLQYLLVKILINYQGMNVSQIHEKIYFLLEKNEGYIKKK